LGWTWPAQPPDHVGEPHSLFRTRFGFNQAFACNCFVEWVYFSAISRALSTLIQIWGKCQQPAISARNPTNHQRNPPKRVAHSVPPDGHKGCIGSRQTEVAISIRFPGDGRSNTWAGGKLNGPVMMNQTTSRSTERGTIGPLAANKKEPDSIRANVRAMPDHRWRCKPIWGGVMSCCMETFWSLDSVHRPAGGKRRRVVEG